MKLWVEACQTKTEGGEIKRLPTDMRLQEDKVQRAELSRLDGGMVVERAL